jgi:hypothetical protein
MDDKITIIEGPPPTFETVADGWPLGLHEGPKIGTMTMTRLRTFNGPALVERCHRAWHNHQTIHLEYRTPEGLEHQTPIVAARSLEVEDGHLLELWLCLTDDDVEMELGYEDDLGSENDDDPGSTDLP